MTKGDLISPTGTDSCSCGSLAGRPFKVGAPWQPVGQGTSSDRQTNRPTDRQTDGQTDRQTDGQIDRQIDRYIHTQSQQRFNPTSQGSAHQASGLTCVGCKTVAVLLARTALQRGICVWSAEWPATTSCRTEGKLINSSDSCDSSLYSILIQSCPIFAWSVPVCGVIHCRLGA